MSTLNETARWQLDADDITPQAWIRLHSPDGHWRGDACGCPDDRCIGLHHDADEPCGCLAVLIRDHHLTGDQQ